MMSDNPTLLARTNASKRQAEGISRRLALGLAATALVPPNTMRAQPLQTLERRRRSGVKIGFANEFPFAFRNPAGQVAGAEYEMARTVFAGLGVAQLEPIVTEFRSLIPGLQASRFDVIVAGLVIQPQRCEQVLFSEPNMRTQWTVLVARGNPRGIHGFDDIARNSSIRLAALQGTAAARVVQSVGVAEGQLTLFPAFPEALAALRAGRVDAMTTLSVTAGDYVRGDTSGRIERAQPFRPPVVEGRPVVNHSAFAFRRGEEELLAAFNRALAEFMPSPERRAIFDRYGLSDDELPRDVTTANLCRPA
jgi:polar amino acid transport system substrate-binding protein